MKVIMTWGLIDKSPIENPFERGIANIQSIPSGQNEQRPGDSWRPIGMLGIMAGATWELVLGENECWYTQWRECLILYDYLYTFLPFISWFLFVQTALEPRCARIFLGMWAVVLGTNSGTYSTSPLQFKSILSNASYRVSFVAQHWS